MDGGEYLIPESLRRRSGDAPGPADPLAQINIVVSEGLDPSTLLIVTGEPQDPELPDFLPGTPTLTLPDGRLIDARQIPRGQRLAGMSRRITTSDAEAIYGIPARTIRRWRDEGRITDPEIDKGRFLWLETEIDQMRQLRDETRLRRPQAVTHP